jgi:flagellar hook assembly protein FlgD
LADSTKVTITIYNFAGQFVRNIDLGRKPVGFYVNKGQAAYWDGKDSLGQSVASGLYLYTLQAGQFKTTRRMVIIK